MTLTVPDLSSGNLVDLPPTLFELRKFVAPEFLFGNGARKLAGRYARKFGGKNVLVVTDPGVIDAGWVGQVLDTLKQEGLSPHVFSDIHPNPRSSEVMEGAKAYHDQNCNLILAIGGGSPMDCAKGIAAVSANHSSVLAFEGVDQIPVPGPPLICIPTTAGSSADVSQFAIINDEGRQIKIAIISKAVVPDLALIDPETTCTMDAYLTACTGMDTLTHAIEAYVSNANSPITDIHALRAIQLTGNYLRQAVQQPENLAYRHHMMLASLHAGLAFSNASLGAVHAMAHSLGGLLDLAHGECNALLLEHVIEHNFDAVPARYQEICRILSNPQGCQTETRAAGSLVNTIRDLRESIGIDSSLQKAGVKPEDFERLSQSAIRDACIVTNPKKMTQADIQRIYESAF